MPHFAFYLNLRTEDPLNIGRCRAPHLRTPEHAALGTGYDLVFQFANILILNKSQKYRKTYFLQVVAHTGVSKTSLYIYARVEKCNDLSVTLISMETKNIRSSSVVYLD